MRIAWLGLGIMGSRMAPHLVRAGHEVVAWTRSPGKAERWAAEHEGARAAATPQEAAEGADVVCTMVVDGDQVVDVLLREGDGAAHGAPDGALVVDCSTIGPPAARGLAGRLRDEHGLRFVDAPVTGSAPRAQDGTLTLMAGADDATDYEQARPLLEAMGALVLHAGPVGHGQLLKVVNNAVAAANAATLAQALVLTRQAGGDPEALVRVLGAGSGGSVMVDLKARPMLDHEFAPLFKLEHMLKDVRLCLEEAQEAGAPFAQGQVARDLYAVARGMGHGADDFAAIVVAAEAAAGRHA